MPEPKIDQQLVQIINHAEIEFKPYCDYNRDLESVTIYWKGDRDYSIAMSDQITVYRSLDTNEVVGCKVVGIGDNDSD